MIVKVGVPTMTVGDLRHVLHELENLWDDETSSQGALDDVEIRMEVVNGGHRANLRWVELVEDHSDYKDGKDAHPVVVLHSEFYV